MIHEKSLTYKKDIIIIRFSERKSCSEITTKKLARIGNGKLLLESENYKIVKTLNPQFTLMDIYLITYFPYKCKNC